MAKPVRENRSSKRMPVEEENLFIDPDSLRSGTHQDLNVQGQNALRATNINDPFYGKGEEVVSPLLPTGSEIVLPFRPSTIEKHIRARYPDAPIRSTKNKRYVDDLSNSIQPELEQFVNYINKATDIVDRAFKDDDVLFDNKTEFSLGEDVEIINGKALSTMESRKNELNTYLSGITQAWGISNPGKDWRNVTQEDIENSKDLQHIQKYNKKLKDIEHSINELNNLNNSLTPEQRNNVIKYITKADKFTEADTHMAQVLQQDTPNPVSTTPQDTPKLKSIKDSFISPPEEESMSSKVDRYFVLRYMYGTAKLHLFNALKRSPKDQGIRSRVFKNLIADPNAPEASFDSLSHRDIIDEHPDLDIKDRVRDKDSTLHIVNWRNALPESRRNAVTRNIETDESGNFIVPKDLNYIEDILYRVGSLGDSYPRTKKGEYDLKKMDSDRLILGELVYNLGKDILDGGGIVTDVPNLPEQRPNLPKQPKDPVELLVNKEQDNEDKVLEQILKETNPILNKLSQDAEKQRTGAKDFRDITDQKTGATYKSFYPVTSEIYNIREGMALEKITDIVNKSNSLNKDAVLDLIKTKIEGIRLGLDPIGPAGPGIIPIIATKNMLLDLAGFILPEGGKIEESLTKAKQDGYTNQQEIDSTQTLIATLVSAGATVATMWAASPLLAAAGSAKTLGTLSNMGRVLASPAGRVIATSIAADAVGTTVYHALKETDVSTANLFVNWGVPLEALDYKADDPRWNKLGKDLITNSALGLIFSGIVGTGKAVFTKDALATQIVDTLKQRAEIRQEINNSLVTFLSRFEVGRSGDYINKLSSGISDQVKDYLNLHKNATTDEVKNVISDFLKNKGSEFHALLQNTAASRTATELDELAATVQKFAKVDTKDIGEVFRGVPELSGNVDINKLSSVSRSKLEKVIQTGDVSKLSKIDNTKGAAPSPYSKRPIPTSAFNKFIQSKEAEIALTTITTATPTGTDKNTFINQVNQLLDTFGEVGVIPDHNKLKIHNFLSDRKLDKIKIAFDEFRDDMLKINKLDAISPDNLEVAHGVTKFTNALSNAKSPILGLVNLANNSYVTYLLSDIPNRIWDAGSTRLNNFVITLGRDNLAKRTVSYMLFNKEASGNMVSRFWNRTKPRPFSSITPSRSGLDVGGGKTNLVTEIMIGTDEAIKQGGYRAVIDEVADKVASVGGNREEFINLFYTSFSKQGNEIVRNSKAEEILSNYFGKLSRSSDKDSLTLININKIKDQHKKDQSFWNTNINDYVSKSIGKDVNVEGLNISFKQLDDIAEEAALLPSFQGGVEGPMASLGEIIPEITRKESWGVLSPYLQFLGRFTRTAGNITQHAFDTTALGLAHSAASAVASKVTSRTLPKYMLGGIYNDLKSPNKVRNFVGKVKIGVGTALTTAAIDRLLSMDDDEFRKMEDLNNETTTFSDLAKEKLLPTMKSYNHALYTAAKYIREGHEVPDNVTDAVTMHGFAIADNYVDFGQKDQFAELPFIKDVFPFLSGIATWAGHTSDPWLGVKDKNELGILNETKSYSNIDSDQAYLGDKLTEYLVDYSVSSALTAMGFINPTLGIAGQVTSMARKTIGSTTIKHLTPDTTLHNSNRKSFGTKKRFIEAVTGVDDSPLSSAFDDKINIFGEQITNKGGLPRPFGSTQAGDTLDVDVRNLLTEPIFKKNTFTVDIKGVSTKLLLDETFDKNGVSLKQHTIDLINKHSDVRGRVDKVMKHGNSNKAQKEAAIRHIITTSWEQAAQVALAKYAKSKGFK